MKQRLDACLQGNAQGRASNKCLFAGTGIKCMMSLLARPREQRFPRIFPYFPHTLPQLGHPVELYQRLLACAMTTVAHTPPTLPLPTLRLPTPTLRGHPVELDKRVLACAVTTGPHLSHTFPHSPHTLPTHLPCLGTQWNLTSVSLPALFSRRKVWTPKPGM